MAAHQRLNPKINAFNAVATAKQEGRLGEPERCEACGREQYACPTGRRGVIWHHHSYREERWLDVIGLCGSCHKKVHSGRIPEPRTGRIYERRKRAA